MQKITQTTASLYSILESMRQRKRQRCFTSSVGPPSSICSLGSRIFYLLFFQLNSALIRSAHMTSFPIAQCRRRDVLLAAAIHILLAWQHSELILVPCNKKQGFKISYCPFFHLPSVSYIFQCSWTHSSLLFPQARDDIHIGL